MLKYPSGPNTGLSLSSLRVVSSKLYASIQLLSESKYWMRNLFGAVLFGSPKNGSSISVLAKLLNGPRFIDPIFVCTFTTILFAGTISLYATNGLQSSIT